ncbi:MAG: RNA polymerase sigma factor [Agriterribacter sp.]
MKEEHFLQLIEEHQAIIHKVCNLYRDTMQDREDLFQEIVFQLWRSVPSFEERSKFSTWMYRVALSTAIAAFRKRKPLITWMPVLPDNPDPGPENTEQRDQLLRALKQLNDGDKAIITLFLEDLSYKEIAEIAGISENNVGVKINRINIKIQKLINQQNNGRQ